MLTNQAGNRIGSLPEPRMTEQRYWMRRMDEPMLKLARNLTRTSREKLARELADIALGMRNSPPERVIQAFAEEQGLSKEALRSRETARPSELFDPSLIPARNKTYRRR